MISNILLTFPRGDTTQLQASQSTTQSLFFLSHAFYAAGNCCLTLKTPQDRRGLDMAACVSIESMNTKTVFENVAEKGEILFSVLTYENSRKKTLLNEEQ